jgi:hypothetical protein
MRYLIDDRNAELEESLKIYRVTLAWAMERGDRFIISLVPEIYDHPDIVTKISALGEEELLPIPPPTFEENLFIEILKSKLSNLTKLPIDIHERPTKLLKIQGKPSAELIRELTTQTAPNKAIAGDLSPVEDINIFLGDRYLYILQDYGKTQVLDLNAEELTSLKQTLIKANLDPDYLVIAPNYVKIL